MRTGSEKNVTCVICNHEKKWHRDGGCQAYTCKQLERIPPHEFDNGEKKPQKSMDL